MTFQSNIIRTTIAKNTAKFPSKGMKAVSSEKYGIQHLIKKLNLQKIIKSNIKID